LIKIRDNDKEAKGILPEQRKILRRKACPYFRKMKYTFLGFKKLLSFRYFYFNGWEGIAMTPNNLIALNKISCHNGLQLVEAIGFSKGKK